MTNEILEVIITYGIIIALISFGIGSIIHFSTMPTYPEPPTSTITLYNSLDKIVLDNSKYKCTTTTMYSNLSDRVFYAILDSSRFMPSSVTGVRYMQHINMVNGTKVYNQVELCED